MRSFSSAWVVLLLLAVAASPSSAEDEGSVVTLIHLNDLHANLVPHLDLVRGEATDGAAKSLVVERGGLARIATVIRRIREENPHSLLMNVGDTYHGGVEGLYTRGNAVVAPVNALGIDVGVPGNWDYAYGPLVTRLRYAPDRSTLARFANWVSGGDAVETPNYPNLAANLRQTFPPVLGPALLPGTLLLEAGGVRIGFIGLTADIVPRMAKPFAWGLEFLQGEEGYRDLVDESARQLRSEGAQVVVVMSELGLHKDVRLADVVAPGVDVFFSAHTHEVTFEPLPSASGALVVESGNDGFIGRMDVTVRDGDVVDRVWSVAAVTTAIPEDPAMAELVAAARAPFLEADVHMEHPMGWIDLPLTEPIDTVIGSTDVLLHRRNALHNPINDMLAEALRRLAGTAVSTSPGFRFDAVVPPKGAALAEGRQATGQVTLEQLYRILPASPNVATGRITGRALKEIIEVELMRVFSEDPFEHSGGWFGSMGGLELDLDLSRSDGERVLAMRLTGSERPIAEDERVSVASCIRPFDDAGTMCGNPGFDEVAPFVDERTGKPWTPFLALRRAFETGDALAKTTAHVADQGRVEQWPEGWAVQPIRNLRSLSLMDAASSSREAPPLNLVPGLSSRRDCDSDTSSAR
jgi:2',3'-cyclic-nucleotide 2'-phosphodiesterase (5'-nucleotidase family)